MNSNENILKKYYSSKCNLIFVRKKKNIYFVKDGYILYNVSVNPLKCLCTTNHLCQHIIFILDNKFNLTCNVIKFIHKILPTFYNFLDDINGNMNNKLLAEINKNVVSDACGICLSQMNNDNNFELNECVTCKKYTHKLCLNKWLNRKNTDKTCIYCKT
jgi:hypothetical protein